MKKWLKNVSFVILLLKSCILFGQDLDAKKIIVIDPGHGGNDSGAIGVNNLKEKSITLEIARSISELAEKKHSKTVEIYQTRYSDTLISLRDRARIAIALNADLYLSLHCNHSDNPNARGVEVYVSNQRSKFLDEATWFGFQLQADLNEKLGFESRGVKFANFQVLRETTDFMSSVLLELGFLSNKDESHYISEYGNLQRIAIAILSLLKIP
ncbi:N-acetylmuramoyl-L-alanine amidase [Allomuricauda sp. d1]|uniref:N-acetylmuramoyl-L-alanine amidase family protein n=1 Tax=Allomuricauda sp. d1 TaxID=3136725 RepID=UPI0031D63ED0